MKIAKGTYIEPVPVIKAFSKDDHAELTAAIKTKLLSVLGEEDCAEFEVSGLQRMFLVDLSWASQRSANGKNFMRSYEEVVADLTADIVDTPAVVDKESGEILIPAKTHKNYKIGEFFYTG